MIERFLTSPRFSWLFRIGWLERIIFYTVRFITFRFSSRETKLLNLDLFGFDFSKWQGIIDFAKVFASGAKFLILRVADGIIPDTRFVEYMQTVLNFFTGKLSAYHYYRPGVDPVLQAQKVISILAPYKPYIRRVWGDFEFSESGPFAAPLHWKRYAQTIIAAGYEFGVYTRKTWWDSRVGALASWFGQFSLWAAQYAPNLTLIPLGWTFASLWQKGTPVMDIGTQSREVDLDIADDTFYAAEYGDVVDPEPPPTGEPMFTYFKITAAELNLRSTGVYIENGSNVVGRVSLNDIVEADDPAVNGWRRVRRIFRNNTEIPLPTSPTGEVWGSNAYMTPVVFIPPTPPPTGDDKLEIFVNGQKTLEIIGRITAG